MRRAIALACGVVGAIAPVAAASDAALVGCDHPIRWRKAGMGSRLDAVICPKADTDTARAEADAAADAVAAEFARLEALWSTWRPDSDLSRLNAAAGGAAIAVAPETVALLTRAVRGSADTDGLFDVTFAPLGALWQFDTPPGSHEPTRLRRVPSQGEIDALRPLVGHRGLVVDAKAGTARLARAGMAVHAGGIGKGAAVDRAVTLLRARGFRHFAVQAGGDLYLAGRKGDRPWRVGIAHPRNNGEILGAIEIADAAFSTSGDYERFAILDGVRYHHILDPRTGWPAAASQSCTVRAKTATDAEVLTKAAFIVGGAAGIALVERLGAHAVIVDREGMVWKSKAIELEPASPRSP